jgi:peptidoglycan hydrolase-like protein with peptidoglycan-binding domain
MAGEPELQKGLQGEWVHQWVVHLERLLARHSAWSGGETGVFDDTLEEAVMAYQTRAGLKVDGIVGEKSWARLMSDDVPPATPAPQAAETQAATAPAPTGQALHPTGATAEEVPASFSGPSGLPAFRYNLPNIPLAEAAFDTGVAYVEVTFSLRGNVSVTFEDSVKGLSVDQSGLRVEATHALGPLTEGVRINGLGSDTPSIGLTVGADGDQSEVRFTPPDTMTFIGQLRIHYTVDSKAGPIVVQGQPGYELKVKVTPHPQPEPEPVPESVGDWMSAHSAALLAVGAVVLITAVAIAAAPETGGASLVLLAVE